MEVAEHELQGLYTWVDEIPLSRPKRNIARDFSDGVLMAELLHHYFPKMVELHNYSSANSVQQKSYNWNTLNTKVCKKLGFVIPKAESEAVVNCNPGAIERVLKLVRYKIAKYTGENPDFGAMAPPPMYQEAKPMQIGGYNGQQAQVGFAAPVAAPVAMPSAPYAAPPAAVAMPSAPYAAPPAAAPRAAALAAVPPPAAVPQSLEADKQLISELKEANEILEAKVRKLEQLVRLKDAKIQTLTAKLQAADLA